VSALGIHWRICMRSPLFDAGVISFSTLGRRLRAFDPAFTLLELLVGIVIVAALGTLAFASYHRVHENTNASKDASNLRQLGMATAVYWTDYGCLPNEAWPTTLNPRYISSWNSFHSPFDDRRPTEDPRTAPASYDLNGNLLGLRPVQVVSPSTCIFMAPLMADAARLQFMSTGWSPSLPSPLSIGSNGTGATGGTHRNGTQITVLFSDMHAGAMEMSTFHSKMPNPEAGHAITDIRWNQ
jgi:type II secretory pathway pseudopilin PulG